MEEYIIETKTRILWQTQLNQWRHIYKLDVISMTESLREDDSITILLKRTKKD